MAADLGQPRRLLHEAVGTVFPSAQLLVVDGGDVLLDEAAGDCDRDTWFDVASLTKPLCTTTLTMRLLETARISLETPLRPDGPTVRLALCHATGLPAWRPLHAELASVTRDGVSLAAHPRLAMRELVRGVPLEYPPGTRSVYSDLGFILLGMALEEATAVPLDAQWRALGFADALDFFPDEARCAPTENGLRGAVHDDNARAMGRVAGHAGLFGTARGVSAVVADLVDAWRGDRARLAGPETVRQFWSPSGIPGSTWCLGWDRPAPVSAGSSSAGARWPRDGVGHLGFTGCSLWIDPPRRRWVVLLSNRVHPSRANEAIKAFRPLIHDAVVEALDGPPAPGSPSGGPVGAA
jgi:CubicO group peptidase (beta-lactamase class C family)